jgi:hypothetical protein
MAAVLTPFFLKADGVEFRVDEGKALERGGPDAASSLFARFY